MKKKFTLGFKINKYCLSFKCLFELRDATKHEDKPTVVLPANPEALEFPIYTNDGYVIQRYLDKDGEEVGFEYF